MKKRYIFGGIIIIVFLAIGGYSFLNSTVEYATIRKAEESGKKVQVNGKCVKEMGSDFDAKTNTFTFYIRDDEQRIAKVEYAGAKPNNFDIATSVVAKGRYENGSFHASEVLTKCPSKYEANAKDGQHPDSVKVTDM